MGAEDVLGRRLMYLDLAIEPFCSSLEPSGHRGTHCRGAVDALGLSIMWYCYQWTNLSGREHWWVREGILLCGSIELFNSSKKMTRRGQYVQRGLVSSSGPLVALAEFSKSS